MTQRPLSLINISLTMLILSLTIGCGSNSSSTELVRAPDKVDCSTQPEAEGCDEDDNDVDDNDDDLVVASFIPEICRDLDPEANGLVAGGSQQTQTITSAEGDTVFFEIFPPTTIDCNNVNKGAHPLILDGHGLEGSRDLSAESFRDLRDAGYAVLTIDQRGFGRSSGRVSVMDPNREGRDLLQILDFAEQNIDYLAWRDNSTGQFIDRPEVAESVVDGVNLVVGSTGFSYGGGFQLLIQNIDPKQRLDAITPQYTWHDLRYSLASNDVVKSLWANVIASVGESNANLVSPLTVITQEQTLPSLTTEARGLENFIRETLITGQLTNVFPRDALDYFQYHSSNYWCELQDNPARPYPLVTDEQLPIRLFPPLSGDERQTQGGQAGTHTLLSQGMRDVLFNFNEAWWNWQCLKQRATEGQDVALITHQLGHILPVVQEGFTDSVSGAPLFCGGLEVTTANTAFFNEKLRGLPADPILELAKSKVCFSLDQTDAVYIDQMDVMAPRAEGFPANPAASDFTEVSFASSDVEFQPVTDLIPVEGQTLNGLVSALNVIAPHSVTLLTADTEKVIAGIPTIDISVSPAADQVCAPITDCESIIFVGFGKRSGSTGAYTLIDDQVSAIRGVGDKTDFELVGIAERLQPGDELALLVYGTHPQFFSTSSRDLLVPVINLNGTVKLPLYEADSPLLTPAPAVATN